MSDLQRRAEGTVRFCYLLMALGLILAVLQVFSRQEAIVRVTLALSGLSVAVVSFIAYMGWDIVRRSTERTP